MNLDLAHSTPVTIFQVTEVVAAAAGLALAALLIFAFTHTWRGIVAGILVLGVVLGGGATYALHAKASFSTAGIRTTNVPRIQEAASKTYGVAVSEAKARTLLAGTDAYEPKAGITTKFGTANLTVHNRPFPDSVEAVSLLWRKSEWVLLIIQPDGTYNQVQRVGEVDQ